MQGLDLDGNEVVIEGDELLGRVFLHEIDHLDGVLMLDRLEPDVRREALRDMRDPRAGSTASAIAAHGRRPRPVAATSRCGSSSSARPPTRCRRSRRCVAAGHDIALVVTQPDRRAVAGQRARSDAR